MKKLMYNHYTPLKAHCDQKGYDYEKVKKELRRGLSVKGAILSYLQKKNAKEIGIVKKRTCKRHTKRKTLSELRKEKGCSWGAFCYRVYVKGWDYKKALNTPVRDREFREKRYDKIMKMHAEGYKTRDIAKTVGLTQNRVNQILKATSSLKDLNKGKDWQVYDVFDDSSYYI